MPSKSHGWIGVDFDGTLVEDPPGHERLTATECGHPLWPMVARIRTFIADGWQIRIFTARVSEPCHKNTPVEEVRAFIEDWSEQYLGTRLVVTNIKDHGMIALIDDRAVHATRNTGALVQSHLHDLMYRAEKAG